MMHMEMRVRKWYRQCLIGTLHLRFHMMHIEMQVWRLEEYSDA